MSSAPVAALVVLLTMSAVLLVSGVAKLRDRRATRDAFTALRIPRTIPADAAAQVLPWAEIGLGVLLLLAPGRWLVPVTVAVVGLMLTYTWLVARALGFESPVSCSCFGSLGRHEIDRTTLARNVLLTALAVVAAWFAVDGGSARGALGELDAADAWALIATTASAAVAVLVVGGSSPAAAAWSPDGEPLDYERRPIPYGVLTLPDGRSTTLTELAATRARLLVVLNPGCAPCDRVATRLDDWAARLDPAVSVLALYPYDAPADVDLPHARELVVLEPELNVRRLLSVGTPSAVLLGADGYLAGGPVAGEDDVVEFVEAVLAELAMATAPGFRAGND